MSIGEHASSVCAMTAVEADMDWAAEAFRDLNLGDKRHEVRPVRQQRRAKRVTLSERRGKQLQVTYPGTERVCRHTRPCLPSAAGPRGCCPGRLGGWQPSSPSRGRPDRNCGRRSRTGCNGHTVRRQTLTGARTGLTGLRHVEAEMARKSPPRAEETNSNSSRSRCSFIGRGSPDRHGIGAHGRIDGRERQAMLQRLADQHAVERIAVQVRQAGETRDAGLI